MSPSNSSPGSLDDEKREYLAQLREISASPGPVENVAADPGLLRVLMRPTSSRRSSSSTRHTSKTRKSSHSGVPGSPLLDLLIAKESHQSSELRSLLQSTTDRLEFEMRRADVAERRAEYLEARIRQADDRLMDLMKAHHQTELTLTRVVEETKRYKMLLVNAQMDLQQAEQDIGNLEEEKARAESDARRARDISRQHERTVNEREARELGRREGRREMTHRFAEGVETGRREGYDISKRQERGKQKKIYTEAFEAGHSEGYTKGSADGRAYERRNALDAFDKFLDDESYSGT